MQASHQVRAASLACQLLAPAQAMLIRWCVQIEMTTEMPDQCEHEREPSSSASREIYTERSSAL